ncbi:deoxyribose-phosphate aldolase [Massilibacterium senegalense]|uniref:deoxyribose-phosphate aldolase n=1 Tax=Massilibacterium senegalense TaxID=1632858 RepID=UPI00078123A2|nr:deoxyribose-phosphate aldolase [Massilibacterium senegalense]
MEQQSVASMIDHTLLKPEATRKEILTLCTEAKEYQFASVCVNPVWVPLVVEMLKGSSVAVCTVIGFPLGASTIDTKVAETKEAVLNGATEIDMVINIGLLKSGDMETVKKEIQEIVQAAQGKVVKVIIETCLLTEKEKITACMIAKEAGAHFVKTSTGFSTGGATVEDVALMRKIVGEKMGVKASGGIRTWDNAKTLIQAGANRIGASKGIQIVEEENRKQEK